MDETALHEIEIKSEGIDRQTSATQVRYNRIAPICDLMERFTELKRKL